MICPKCGDEQTETNIECAKCGVIFSKVGKASPSMIPVSRVSHREWECPGEVSILRIVSWIHLVLGILGAGLVAFGLENDGRIPLAVIWTLEAVAGSTVLFGFSIMLENSSRSRFVLEEVASHILQHEP